MKMTQDLTLTERIVLFFKIVRYVPAMIWLFGSIAIQIIWLRITSTKKEFAIYMRGL